MLAINGFGTVSCLGSSLSDARELLRSGGVAPEAANKLSLPGIAPDSLREADLSRFDTSGEDYFRLLHAERIRTESRSIVLLRHSMAELAPELDAAFSRFGKERTACVIGTSTASLSEAERSLEDGGEISFDFSLSDVACMSDYVRDTLGIKGPEAGGKGLEGKTESFKEMIEEVRKAYPGAGIFATTLREVLHAGEHLWGALLWEEDGWILEEPRPIQVYDRIGGGDGFVGGLLYGVLEGWRPEKQLQFAWAGGALAASVAEDYATPVSEEQLFNIYKGNARVKR